MTSVIIENKAKRRDKLVIIAEIINIASNGTSKTHLMFKANLSFSQLNQYLVILTQTGLIERVCEDGKDTCKATKKGLEFMEKQYDIISLLNVDYRQNSVKTSFDLNPYPKTKISHMFIS